MQRLAREPLRIRLLFDFYTAGIRDEEICEIMRGEFERYRESFRPIVHSVLQSEALELIDVTTNGLAAVIVSFIKGCAVQAMIDPAFDIESYLSAAEALLLTAPVPPTNNQS